MSTGPDTEAASGEAATTASRATVRINAEAIRPCTVKTAGTLLGTFVDPVPALPSSGGEDDSYPTWSAKLESMRVDG